MPVIIPLSGAPELHVRSAPRLLRREHLPSGRPTDSPNLTSLDNSAELLHRVRAPEGRQELRRLWQMAIETSNLALQGRIKLICEMTYNTDITPGTPPSIFGRGGIKTL